MMISDRTTGFWFAGLADAVEKEHEKKVSTSARMTNLSIFTISLNLLEPFILLELFANDCCL